MKQSDIRDVIVPIITPMNADETLSTEELKRQIDRMIDSGVSGIFCLGTNGEAYALSLDEKKQVIQTAVTHVAGRVPVYAGTGCITTRETIELSRYAKDCGADILSVITPWFGAATQDQLYRHYAELTDKVELPIILYNIPARTGNQISPDLWSRLATIDRIWGIKDSSGNFNNILAYIQKSPSQNKAVLAGSDSLILWTMMAGGAGCVSGCANVYPSVVTGICRAFHEGNLELGKKLQAYLQHFRDVFKYGNPNTIVKLAVRELGYDVGPCRAPFSGLSDEGMNALKQVLQAYPDKDFWRNN